MQPTTTITRTVSVTVRVNDHIKSTGDIYGSSAERGDVNLTFPADTAPAEIGRRIARHAFALLRDAADAYPVRTAIEAEAEPPPDPDAVLERPVALATDAEAVAVTASTQDDGGGLDALPF